MDIHVVLAGETIYSIAERYRISVAKLIQNNGLVPPFILVVGQTLVIVYPEQIHIVQEGDTLFDIAVMYGITVRELLRNNPFLSDREYIFPGETLVISYNREKGKITTNGYAYPFIDREMLRKTLPFLTYLSIFNYRTTAEADIIGIDDTEIIQIAKEYGVAPIMLLSTLTDQGLGNFEVTYNIINDQELVNRHIDNILYILSTKGYYGLNITVEYINMSNYLVYNNYIAQLTSRLNNEGFPVWVTITPTRVFDGEQVTFERVDYSGIGQVANGILILSYAWGYTFGPPVAPTSLVLARGFLDYIVLQVPREKIDVGLPIIGYDWQLPYEEGVTRAVSMNPESAVALAFQVGAIIQYDEIAGAPYFEYVVSLGEVERQHIVWFKDARSIEAIVNFVPEYGLRGVSIWNIMVFLEQMWLVINSQYEIETVLN